MKDERPDVTVDTRTREKLLDQPERYKRYSEALEVVLAEDPALAHEYRESQGDPQGPPMILPTSLRITGVELFRPGEWNGDAYTEQDIDDMVKAAAEMDWKPAVKLGHTKGPGDPAYGYVEKIRKENGKLVGDLTNINPEVWKAIKSGMYSRVSAEIMLNLRRSGKVFRRALKAVALLGSEIPAVAGLKPLNQAAFAVGEFEAVRVYERAFGIAVLPSDDVDRRTREYMRERDERSYTEAMKAVLARDPALHVAYLEEQAGELKEPVDAEAVLLGKHRGHA